MIHLQQNARVAVGPLPLPIFSGQQPCFTAPRLRSRSAPPALLHQAPHAAQRKKLLGLPLVRGLGKNETISSALRSLAAGKTVHLTLFWGFRKLDSNKQALNAAEVNTLRAYAAMAQAMGEHCEPVLLLADAHAMHNGIPEAIWKPYYDVVARQAAGMGVRTVMLSSVMTSLSLSPAALAEQGKTLVVRPGAPAQPGAAVLTGNEWCQLKLQSRHLCDRFPQVFKTPVGEAARRHLYDPRALAYVQFRAAEGRYLLPALKDCFDGDAVLPVHVSDPATERLGVHGLHIYTMDADNVRQVSIPWK